MMLKIDPDFKNLIPPLSPGEFEQLEQNLLSEKSCRDAISIWKGFIVDGHNRYAICQRHNIPFKVEKIRFGSKADALVWIAEHQLGRRNLSDALRIDLAASRVKLLNTGGIVRKAIAETAGVSEQTVHRYMKVVGSGDSGLIEQLRKGDMKINTAYNKLKAKSRVVRVIDIKPCEDDEIGIKCYGNVIKQLNKIERFFRDVEVAYAEIEVDWFRGYLEKRLRWFEG